MAVPFDVIDTQNRHHRQVLLKSQRTQIAQVLTRQDSSLPAPSSGGQKARIRDAFDNALAVLVACARIAELERPRHVADRTVGLVDDQWRTIWPSSQRVARFIGQRPTAVHRLFDRDGPPADLPEARLRLDALPKSSEGVKV